MRAFLNDVRAGAVVEGGSTITQQLAKNQFFTQERTIERKVAEMFMAVEIESRMTKDEILELYANSVYFGDGHYGVYAASQGYFGKTPSEVSDGEAIMLAGLPNAPSAYSPSVNPELAAKRQSQVAEKMGGSRLRGMTRRDANRRLMAERDHLGLRARTPWYCVAVEERTERERSLDDFHERTLRTSNDD